MPLAGVSMLFLGLRISYLDARPRNVLSIVAVLVALAAVPAHYQPYRVYLGPFTERLGGEAAMGGYALLMLIGVARTKVRSGMMSMGTGIAFAIILLFAWSPLYWHVFGRALFTNRPDAQGCLQQNTGVTCAPASAAMLVNKYGIIASEGLIAERAGTNIIIGTNEYSLVRALDSLATGRGLKASAGHLSLEQARALDRPFVAYIVLPTIGGHAILVTDLGSDRITLIDPLTGALEQRTTQEFEEEWTGTAIWLSNTLK